MHGQNHIKFVTFVVLMTGITGYEAGESTAMMQTATYSEMSVCIYQTTRCHILKGKLPSTNRHIATRFVAFSNNRTA